MVRRGLVALAGVAVVLVGLAGPAAAATTGTQRFTFVVREEPGQETCRVIATGPITGVGTCVPEDIGDDQTIVHVFINGASFDLIPTTVNETDDFNEQACVFHFTSTETFVLGGGTGIYSGVTGSGTDTVNGTFIARRTPSGCDEDNARGVIVAQATGTATV